MAIAEIEYYKSKPIYAIIFTRNFFYPVSEKNSAVKLFSIPAIGKYL